MRTNIKQADMRENVQALLPTKETDGSIALAPREPIQIRYKNKFISILINKKKKKIITC
jgi:hypothetical protein